LEPQVDVPLTSAGFRVLPQAGMRTMLGDFRFWE